ncbi:hypothetical protein O181_051893 [Austropuccinia psidii MF-1]|uniref:Cytosol aminopeptidase domain-containing protein n=1 Tax=Austropuccinia psidii MF-1 TaxID=1389203 RepID=A0A9Q3E1N7_9BASI|nr:hypothetical protein [Austropuccinia psidii MF-1]
MIAMRIIQDKCFLFLSEDLTGPKINLGPSFRWVWQCFHKLLQIRVLHRTCLNLSSFLYGFGQILILDFGVLALVGCSRLGRSLGTAMILSMITQSIRSILNHHIRFRSSICPNISHKQATLAFMSNTALPPAIILGVKPDGTTIRDESLPRISQSVLGQHWNEAEPKGKALETKIFYNLEKTTVAAIGVGRIPDRLSDLEKAEKTRKVVGSGAKVLKEHISNTREVLVDPIWSSHAAAVAATLATFHYNVKTKKDAVEKRKPIVYKPLLEQSVQLETEKPKGKLISLDWSTGLIFAQAQNLARELMETGANLMTPTKFCERIKAEFQGLANVEIHVREKPWAEKNKMHSFLSVARGTEEPCKFLEIHYKGNQSATGFKPSVALVGKGVTFDSGGISLKPGAGMKLMRADMGGAAAVTSAAWAIAKLGIPIDLVVCTPLTENMPSGHATKPGDIIYAMNGKSIEVDNTDAEGRLILADALYYASSVYKPKSIIDCATLTGAMMIALGEPFSGVFSTSDKLWDELDAAGKAEHDRFWRMPFDDFYLKQVDTSNADLCNIGSSRSAGSCTAAIFLREFVDGLACNAPEGTHPPQDTIAYAHLDIAGAMECTIPDAYNPKGLTGRPVRALIEYVRQQAALE